MKTIAVVIPCHDDGSYIEQALDSVAAQTRPADQVVVVVDSSTDESESVASRHPLRPKVMQCNRGNAAAARNLGVSHCDTDLVAFLDADDWWAKAHLEASARVLENGPDVAYMGHYNEYWQEKEEYLEKEPLFHGAARSGLTAEEFYHHFLGRNAGWPTVGMVISCNRFREVGGFDEGLVRRHDAELFARVVHRHTWAYNPTVSFCYRKQVPKAISNHRAECSYYRMLADIEIARLFGVKRSTSNLRLRARSCMSETLRFHSNPDLFRNASGVCFPYLDPARALFYRMASYAPGLFRRTLAGVGALKRIASPEVGFANRHALRTGDRETI
jgi:glycosyltransferase involved in cell wall biosynthesis